MSLYIQFTNNANTILASGITNVATSLVVQTGDGAKFPAISGSQYFYCTLADAATGLVIEIVKVTARSGDTFTIVRGQEGTTAHSYLANDKVELRLTAAGINDLSAQTATSAVGSTLYLQSNYQAF